jgi:hypothetical protein
MNLNKDNRINYSLIFIISCLTLNLQDHNFYPGLDGSYYWAFSYIITYLPEHLSKVTSIYGPLAFLGYPVCYGDLIAIGYGFQIFLKFLLGFLLFRLSRFVNVTPKKVLLLFLLTCFPIFSPEAYINLIIILFIVLYYFESKLIYLVCISIFTAFGYYYKCSAGLSGVLLQVVFLIYITFLNRKIDLKFLFRIISFNLFSFLLFGLILFQSFITIIDSIVTYYHNIVIFSEASSLYNNTDNFFWLILCGVSLLAIFFINKDRGFRLFWLLSGFFLYTGYTHSIVRMDYSHYMGFLYCLVLIILLTGIFYAKISNYTFLLLAIAFYSYYGNLRNKYDYGDFIISIQNGPKNIYNTVVKYDTYKKHSFKRSVDISESESMLSDTIKKVLSKGTVDFFPWELSYVVANKLKNWKPRPYLQNLNMSAFFDKKTGEYFNSKEAPDHLIWHVGIGGFLDGIDYSYLLNNEFFSILAIFSNYTVVTKDNKVILLNKRQHPIKIAVEDLEKSKEVNSGDWIELPKSDAILGCTVEYDFNMLRGLKKLAYRDDEFFLEYKTSDGKIFKKRIWPGDAKEFTWLTPLSHNISDSADYKDVTAIRFYNTNTVIHSGKLELQFKTIKFERNQSKKALYEWFNSLSS